MLTAKKPRGHKRGEVTSRQMEAVREVLRADGAPLANVAGCLGLSGEGSVRVLVRVPLLHGLLEWVHEGRGPANMKTLRVTQRGLNALAHFGMLPGELPAPGARVFAKKGDCNLQAFPISCGCLRESCAEPRYVTGPAGLFRNYRDGDYLIDADGDSLEQRNNENAIWRGDVVLMRPDIWPGNSEIAHVSFIENGVYECTLKEFHFNEIEKAVTLHAFNPKYVDIVLPAAEVRVHGVMMGCIRQKMRK